MRGITALIHLANHPNWYSGSPEMVYGENVSMNMNIFQAAANSDCERHHFFQLHPIVERSFAQL